MKLTKQNFPGTPTNMSIVVPPKQYYYLTGKAILKAIEQQTEFNYDLFKQIRIDLYFGIIK